MTDKGAVTVVYAAAFTFAGVKELMLGTHTFTSRDAFAEWRKMTTAEVVYVKDGAPERPALGETS